MTLEDKIKAAKNAGIHLTFEDKIEQNMVGVYEFFYILDRVRTCFYVGKSTDVMGRLFGSNGGHIYNYMSGRLDRLVPQKIDEYLKLGYEIEVDYIEVDYKDTDFSKASHRLALKELLEIVRYNEMGQCLFQYPEGTRKCNIKYWEKYYRKNEVQ